MRKLFLIPARMGSKGLPGKNIKVLDGKPLIAYSIEFAQNVMGQDDILCISTDDLHVIEIAHSLGVKVPFIRPADLANDKSNTFDVIKHALNFFEKNNQIFDSFVLLQPTSPFRNIQDFQQMMEIYMDENPDMVVSVKVSKDNPFFNMFIEGASGNLEKVVDDKSDYTHRQFVPSVYSYNGSIYIVNASSFKDFGNFNFPKKIKFLMNDVMSIDIDTPADWALAEYYLKQNIL